MDALRLEYEDELRRRSEEATSDIREDVPPAMLRTRREVGKKLIELGLAADPSDFGRHRHSTVPGEGGRRKKTRAKEDEEQQLETLDGGSGIAVMKKRKWKKRPVRQRDSSPELNFDTREEFSDEERVSCRWCY